MVGDENLRPIHNYKNQKNKKMTTLGLMIAVFFGVTLRLLYKFTSARKRKSQFNWELAITAALLSIITNFGLVLVREDLTAILPYSYLLAGIYGYTGDSIFRGVAKLSTPNFSNKNSVK